MHPGLKSSLLNSNIVMKIVNIYQLLFIHVVTGGIFHIHTLSLSSQAEIPGRNSSPSV